MKAIKLLSQSAMVLSLATTIGMSAVSASANANSNTAGDKSDIAVTAQDNLAKATPAVLQAQEAQQQVVLDHAKAVSSKTVTKTTPAKVNVTFRYTQYTYKKASLTEPTSIVLKGKVAQIKKFALYGKKTAVETQYGWVSVHGVKMDANKTDINAFKKLATSIKQELPSAKVRAAYYTVLPGGKASYKATVKHNINEYKTVVAKKAVKHLRKGTKVSVKGVTKHGKAYKLVLTNGHVITANKHFVTLHK